MPRDDATDYSARGAALLAARASEGEWPPDAFPSSGAVAEPDDGRAKAWDDLWTTFESARQAVARHDHATR